jgi:hypothetical protein
MEQPPPQGYVEYPRDQSPGSYQQLKDLTDGYFGLNNAFLINLLLSLAGNAYFRTAGAGADLGLNLAFLAVVAVVVFFATLGPNKRLGAGLGWSPSGPTLASVLVALNSALCCGIIGYIVLQSMAMKRIRDYGLKGGFFGLKKKDVEARLAQLETGQP